MPDRVQIKHILQTSESWSGTPLPGFSSGKTEFKILLFTIKPGGKTTIHVHPLNGAGYMISGELTMFSTEDPHGSFENPKQVKKATFKRGEAWAESVNIWHYGENQGKVDAEFVLMFAGQVDIPPTFRLLSKPHLPVKTKSFLPNFCIVISATLVKSLRLRYPNLLRRF
ncbi:MAG: cupin domain-containing protein [Chlamydiia bacterium]|nr:cupin domain-containing protein [Chlamydiia bacterium]